MSGIDFQAQISAIMEMLAGAAVAEICKLIEEGCATLRLEINHSLQENEFLRNRVRVMERALLKTEREREPSGFSQLKRPAVSSRTDHSSTDQHEERPEQANSVKYEPVDLDSEPDVLIVKEEVVQPSCSSSSYGVQLSVRDNLCQTDRVGTAAFPSEEPNAGTRRFRGSSEEGKAALTAESAVHEVVFVNDVDTIEHGVVQSEANIDMDMKTASEGAETGSGFDQQHLEFLSAQQSSSHSEVKSDFLSDESGPAEEELDGLAAVLQSGSDDQQGNLGFVDSFSGTSLDHVSWICDPQQVHGEERVYRCGRCGRQFPQLCRLKRHERVHTGEKPFRCSKCGKYFSQANNLKVHQSVHTGERRFSCTQCGKNFSFLSNLIRHKAVHSGK